MPAFATFRVMPTTYRERSGGFHTIEPICSLTYHVGRCYVAHMRNNFRILLVGFTFLASILGFAGLAGAQGNSSDTYVGSETGSKPAPEQVLSSIETKSVAPAPAQAASAEATPLAFTGGDAMVLAVVGGTGVVIGAAFLVASRRRTAQA